MVESGGGRDDQLRKKINAFLATKEMTQKAFLAEIQVNPGSLNNFLKLKGEWNGTGNGTFWGAQRFFIAREAAEKALREHIFTLLVPCLSGQEDVLLRMTDEAGTDETSDQR